MFLLPVFKQDLNCFTITKILCFLLDLKLVSQIFNILLACYKVWDWLFSSFCLLIHCLPSTSSKIRHTSSFFRGLMERKIWKQFLPDSLHTEWKTKYTLLKMPLQPREFSLLYKGRLSPISGKKFVFLYTEEFYPVFYYFNLLSPIYRGIIVSLIIYGEKVKEDFSLD